MSAHLRAVLHRCADLLADALEDELSAAQAPTKIRRTTRTKERTPRALPAVPVDELTERRASAALRRQGLA